MEGSSTVIGIDIGGTKTAFGLVNSHGQITAHGSLPTAQYTDPEEYVAALKKALHNMPGNSYAVGIGIGAPNGNIHTGNIVFAPNLPWKGVVPLAHMISKAMGIPAKLTNDANAAAMGEMKYGAAKGMKDFIMVTLGTGVGSGFVANGQIVYGHDGLAGELGHVIAVRDGRRCGCGRLGCLEAYTSATGMAATAEEWLSAMDAPTLLRPFVGSVTTKDIYDAALQNDPLALQLFDYTAKILGQTLADMVAITSPEAIVFFGGLAHAGDHLLHPLKTHLEHNLLPIYKNKVGILKSALPGNDAAILGASALAW